MCPLEILAIDQNVTTLRLEGVIGRADLLRVHADARFFNNDQGTTVW
jgi:hypothetical protein